MTYSEKIKELHQYSLMLILEYQIIAHQISTYLRMGSPVEQDLIRLQDKKQREFTKVINEHSKLILKITRKQIKFNDPFDE